MGKRNSIDGNGRVQNGLMLKSRRARNLNKDKSFPVRGSAHFWLARPLGWPIICAFGKGWIRSAILAFLQLWCAGGVRYSERRSTN